MANGREQRPIHPILVPVGAAFFLGALITDLLYVATVSTQWETFSIWLLTAGLIVAGLAGIALLFDLIAGRRSFRPAWVPLLAAVVAALLSLINAFVHTRDGYTAVMPSGLALSAIVALIIVFMGWNRWTLSHRSAAAG